MVSGRVSALGVRTRTRDVASRFNDPKLEIYYIHRAPSVSVVSNCVSTGGPDAGQTPKELTFRAKHPHPAFVPLALPLKCKYF